VAAHHEPHGLLGFLAVIVESGPVVLDEEAHVGIVDEAQLDKIRHALVGHVHGGHDEVVDGAGLEGLLGLALGFGLVPELLGAREAHALDGERVVGDAVGGDHFTERRGHIPHETVGSVEHVLSRRDGGGGFPGR